MITKPLPDSPGDPAATGEAAKAIRAPTSTPFSVDGASATMGTASGLKRSSLLGSLNSQLPRVIGAGMLVIYVLGTAEQLFGIKWDEAPPAAMSVVVQVLDHFPFLLLGYAMMFWPNLEDPRRHLGRVALKLTSQFALVICLLHLVVGGVGMWASEQLYRREQAILLVQTANQETIMQRAVKLAPTLTEAQLHEVYLELVPAAKVRGKTPVGEPLRSAVAALATSRIKEIHTTEDFSHHQLVWRVVLTTIKNSALALLAVVLFFLIWDQTPKMRAVRIFTPAGDPNLALASQTARWFRRLQRWGDGLFKLPDFDNYRWYRHLRRWWQRKFKKDK